MVAYERVCRDHRPDWVVVVGDVNSTVACTLAAKKVLTPVAHLEAGLRSGDRTMPEELNRIATDALADLLWTPSRDGNENLLREGIPEARIDFVGNIMIDSYEMMRAGIESAGTRARFGLEAGQYALVTLHRPSNVDDAAALGNLVHALVKVAAGHTGYSHSWRTRRFWRFKRLVMGSVETLADAQLAQSLGWRTFRPAPAGEQPADREFACPASAESGHRLTCEQCGACNGANGNPRRASVLIWAHGSPATLGSYRRMLDQS